MIEYDGYLDRSRLGPRSFCRRISIFKKIFFDFQRVLFIIIKKKLIIYHLYNLHMSIKNWNIMIHIISAIIWGSL